jgi:putative glutamine amidotransferase
MRVRCIGAVNRVAARGLRGASGRRRRAVLQSVEAGTADFVRVDSVVCPAQADKWGVMRDSTPPLIAVTTSEVRESANVTLTRHGEPPQHEMALGLKYLQAVEAAGGIPVVVPPLHAPAVEPLLDRCSALLLSGGPDVAPHAYGRKPHAELGPTEPVLDDFEIALTRAADARGMPILAVCRGLQLLNVARGGTLHQHLPDVVGDDIAHRQAEPGSRVTHWVKVAPGSQVSSVLGSRRTKVNSFHHQAVEELGEDLVPVAWAPDGTVEALEAADRDFVVAVQWHAECLVARPAQSALFRALVDAARDYERAGTGADLTYLPVLDSAA